ncbi:hypothetical protein G6F31_019918 [Rhizopus arrhizus]|nr:hypothetical protein G6F31_019918 [Rhizopus arrhizus]
MESAPVAMLAAPAPAAPPAPMAAAAEQRARRGGGHRFGHRSSRTRQRRRARHPPGRMAAGFSHCPPPAPGAVLAAVQPLPGRARGACRQQRVLPRCGRSAVGAGPARAGAARAVEPGRDGPGQPPPAARARLPADAGRCPRAGGAGV